MSIPSRRGRAIIALLALAPDRSLTRERLMGLLWPDRSEPQARASLRQELSSVRRALGPDAAVCNANGDIVRLDGVAADIDLLRDPASAVQVALESASLGLLEDIEIASEPLEECLAEQRRAIDERRRAILETAIAAAEANADWVRVRELAGGLATLDPLSEAAVAARMRVASAAGRAPEALIEYDTHAARLRAELDVEPGEALRSLRARIQSGEMANDAPVETEGAAIFRRPSVLVTGLDCLSAEPDDAMLASAIAGDLATALSCWRWFPVLMPSVVGWRGTRDAPLADLAAQSGAAYVVSGDLRRAGQRLRLTVNLSRASDGRALWSQNFDGTLADAFAFQDEVSKSVVARLAPEISHAEAERIRRMPPRDLSAWQLVAQADDVARRSGTGYGDKAANEAQLALVERALERDPDYARAWSRLAKLHWHRFIMSWEPDREKAAAASLAASERAMAIDPEDWEALAYHALVHVFSLHDHARGAYFARAAVSKNPSSFLARHALGCTLENLGQPAEALEQLDAIFKLDPEPPSKASALGDITTCAMLIGDHERALAAARQLMIEAPDYLRGMQRCAAAFGAAGAVEEGARALQRVVELQPDFSEAYVRQTYPFARSEDLEAFIDGLRRAGWRED